MGAFQIIFLAINLAIPYWLWSSSSKDKSTTDWSTWEKNVARLVESDEGFPGCSSIQVVDIFHELCEGSFRKFKEGKGATMERASQTVVFACNYHNDTINLSWRLEQSKEEMMDCKDPGGDIIERGPGFIFTNGGKIRAIEFLNQKNQREQIPYRNCRIKAMRAKKLSPPPSSRDAFLQELGRLPKDPSDYLVGNLMCFTFDSSPLWKPWRDKYYQ